MKSGAKHEELGPEQRKLNAWKRCESIEPAREGLGEHPCRDGKVPTWEIGYIQGDWSNKQILKT